MLSGEFTIDRNYLIYYEQQVKGELKRIHISGYRYNEKLKPKTDGSKSLTYTGRVSASHRAMNIHGAYSICEAINMKIFFGHVSLFVLIFSF